MSESGRQDVLGLIYADNTIGHTMSGKAVARAMRGNMLIDAALNTLLTAAVLTIDLQNEE